MCKKKLSLLILFRVLLLWTEVNFSFEICVLKNEMKIFKKHAVGWDLT